MPFILRNIQLIGIDSVNVPIDQRLSLWQQMADLQIADELVVQEITLDQLPETASKLLAGTHQGRTLVLKKSIKYVLLQIIRQDD